MVHKGLNPGAAIPGPSGNPARGIVDTVLFDLDGTLADTLPDLAAAMNAALSEHGSPPLAPLCYRGTVSGGSLAMIRAALGPNVDPELAQRIRRIFLALYAERIAVGTGLFPGIDAVLSEIEERGLAWGIVTNKPHDLTRRLTDALGLSGRASCVVSGDTLRHAKPHPEPILHACRVLSASPESCLFVGDSPGDVTAGRGAGVRTLVALYGYLPDGDDARRWGAHGYIERPLDLLAWLDGARGRGPRPPVPAALP